MFYEVMFKNSQIQSFEGKDADEFFESSHSFYVLKALGATHVRMSKDRSSTCTWYPLTSLGLIMQADTLAEALGAMDVLDNGERFDNK